MIKCKIERGGVVQTKAKGTGKDLMLETLALVALVYRNIKKQDPEVAEAYKRDIMANIINPKSPVWEEENHVEE